MKTNLSDVTFIIAIKLDSIQRLENIIVVINCLCRYFDTNIVILEADNYNNGILKYLLNKKVRYLFIEDRDPIFHRTKYFNQMVKDISSPYIALWDSDIVIDKNAILEAVTKLRNKEADITLPYNGICLEIPEIIRTLFIKKNDLKILHRHQNKMDRLYPHLLVGGAVIVDREKYIQAGMENEKHYGWGNDDFDRHFRFVALNYKVYRTNKVLFHLWHPRGNNSQFRSFVSQQISDSQHLLMKNSSKEEIDNRI
ncbi:GT2 family glycosyltransferase [Dysgonomonas alginatilytica]|uniref:GT2 family glycosyltransferase n=1 Tax=Dysgonomonas alginatilytica TaxID=1605892 RepID=A0A2V3PQ44_9BACT|nr:galactosyltransferase-related protein [Dysgonomonas alginatilytica]PXV65849.1 GT2 family glycosyltransferase [Dysgonomonas alginatilytica]